MKIGNWNTNTQKVRAWAENQDPSDNLQAVILSLTLGDNAANDDLRSTYWTAVRSIGSTMDNFPTARRGRESTLTDSQDSVIMTVEASPHAAFAAIPIELQSIMLAVYATFQAYADKQVSSAHTVMTTAIKEDRWDGETLVDGVPQITPTPVKANVEDSDEE